MTPFGFDPETRYVLVTLERDLAIREASLRRMAREVRRNSKRSSHRLSVSKWLSSIKGRLTRRSPQTTDPERAAARGADCRTPERGTSGKEHHEVRPVL